MAHGMISVAQLARLVGTPDAPAVVDVCVDEDFALDPRVVPGAVRVPFREVDARADDFAGLRVVVVCQKGSKLSQGAAAVLRAHGVAAEALEGGMVAWAEADLPAVPVASVPADGGALWVTRARPKIDRVACPWLIRRFVRSDARFLFVAPAAVPAVAEKFGATAFDVEDAPFGHVNGRCTFDAMVEAFGLRSPAMDRLATLVRAADTGNHSECPEAAGLLAVSVGLSRMIRDDVAQVDAGMGIYDALYRWARDGQGEEHSWPERH